MKIKKMLSLILVSGILACGVNASIAMASEGTSNDNLEQSPSIENTQKDNLCPISGNIVESGKKNCKNKGQKNRKRDTNKDGVCDITGNSIKAGKINCQNKKQMKKERDLNGDGICDITGNPIGTNRNNCN
ncbi:hypothetical protein [Clostridium tarantellae]|uniref:Calcium-binding protein n=1 Tax=Clostridium tarantellae TaxID=39493 RepID=A0A6I1MSA4_9CLOT|nr:hypothetical protein [Clostridium tarantellae]MPQ45077.1 hypothetical protein [Clostridium tarantellae]